MAGTQENGPDLNLLLRTVQQLQQAQTTLQQQLQSSMQQSQQAAEEARKTREENAQLMMRIQQSEADVRTLGAVNEALREERTQSMEVMKAIPEALAMLGKERDKKSLFDSKGLGKPQTLTDDQTDQRFRLWSIKLEDYVAGIFGERFREAMQWAAEFDTTVTSAVLTSNYGSGAVDPTDVIEDVEEMNSKLYSALRSTTVGTPFDVVDNAESGNGLDAWRLLHRKFDPGGRKRVMLNALTNPDRATYDTLAGALERWRALRARYNRKKDHFWRREELPESLSMDALEKLVPKDLEQHLQMNYSRFKTYDEMEEEVRVFVEAKTGAKLTVSNNFSQSSSEAVPMDVGSLIQAVRDMKNLNAFMDSSKGKGSIKGKGKGKGAGQPGAKVCHNCGKPGHFAKDCWSKPKDGGKSRSKSAPRFAGKCHVCGKEGHRAKDCRRRDAKGSGKGGKGGSKKGVSSLENAEPEKEADAGGLDLCHISDESWLRINFDTGAAVTALPMSFKSEKHRGDDDRRPFKTASGEALEDHGRSSIVGEDENGAARRISGHVTNVHKVLLSASGVHAKGFDSWLGEGGGCLFRRGGRLHRELCKTYNRWSNNNSTIPLHEENGVYNLYLRTKSGSSRVDGKRSEATSIATVESEEHSGKKKVTWADITEEEIRNDSAVDDAAQAALEPADEEIEVEEAVEARPARPGFNPDQPTQREVDEHLASGHAVYRSWCPQCIAGWGLGQRHHRIDHEAEVIPVVRLLLHVP